ncbi:MAG: HEPN domain-containing protein [Candidatus Binatia bacterium]|nr:HEPN domain-containing protein [Candidatus Binatia bacterium]
MTGRAEIARTWLEQAEADLAAAQDSAAARHYEWACFQAQQAGEKALKAFLYGRGRTSIITHSLRRLREECAGEHPAFAQLDDACRFLDQYYIATRYPNGLDQEVPPARYYDKKDAEQCIEFAHSILEHVKRFWPG